MTKTSPTPVGERSSARMAAVQALYEIDITSAKVDDVLTEFLKDRWKSLVVADESEEEDFREKFADLAQPDPVLLAELIRGVEDRKETLDGIIGPSLKGDWTVERLEVIVRAILRAGTFELLTMGDIPAHVVINEYMNVSNAFFDDSQPKLINGVLDRLARTLRAPEMEKSE